VEKYTFQTVELSCAFCLPSTVESGYVGTKIRAKLIVGELRVSSQHKVTLRRN